MRPTASLVGGLLGLLAGVLGTAGLLVSAASRQASAADQLDVLVDGVRGAGDVALTADGQTVCRVDESRRAIVAFDPLEPAARRDAVGPVPEAGAVPVEIACIDGSVIAAVCRAGEEWSLRTWRLAPDHAADPGSPLQTVPLGRSAGGADDVHLAVSRSGKWLAIGGLPSPLPSVQRRAIAGSRVGPATERNCPRVPGDVRIVAVAAGPADEVVLFERRVDPAAERTTTVSFHGPTGRCLLRLDTGLRSIRDAAFSAGNGLWVVGGDSASPEEPEGLWRLDAILREGRQTIRPVSVVKIAGGRSIAAAERLLVLGSDKPGRTVVRIDTTTPRPVSPPTPPTPTPPSLDPPNTTPPNTTPPNTAADPAPSDREGEP